MTVSNSTLTGNLIMKIHSNHLAFFTSHKGKRRKIETLKDFYVLLSFLCRILVFFFIHAYFICLYSELLFNFFYTNMRIPWDTSQDIMDILGQHQGKTFHLKESCWRRTARRIKLTANCSVFIYPTQRKHSSAYR